MNISSDAVQNPRATVAFSGEFRAEKVRFESSYFSFAVSGF